MCPQSKILIVDDEVRGQKTLAALLHAPEYELAFAGDGAAALAQAKQFEPDLILLDVMMPDLDGFEVCRRIRAMPDLAEVPVVMVTALDDDESRLQGLEAGADDFISKPFNRAELRSRVRTITRLNRHRRLVTARAKFERLFELLPDGLMVVTADGTLLLLNPALRQMLGLDADARGDGSAFDFVTTELRQTFITQVRVCLANADQIWRGETLFTRADGTCFAAEITCTHFVSEEMDAAQLVVRDISARKAAEQQIQLQLTRLEALNTIGTALAAKLDLRAVVDVFLDQVVQRLGVDAVDILLFNPQTQQLEFVAGRGFRTEALSYTRLKLGEGYAGKAAQENRIVKIHDLAHNLQQLVRSPLLQQEQFVSYAAVPLVCQAQSVSYAAVPMVTKGNVKGVIEILQRAPIEMDANWNSFVQSLGQQAALAIDNAELFRQLAQANAELREAYDTTLVGWSRALDLRDKETEHHTQRVVELTLALARALNVPEAEMCQFRWGALLHDIGKMGIPDAILLKSGQLTDEEWGVMRKHPEYARQLLSPIKFLGEAIEIPSGHHERWDGTGYPRGLAGEGIPLAARIFAVVDVWDALTSDRPYHAAWSKEKARDYIRGLAGIHFDPAVVQAFIQLMEARDGV